MIGNLGSRVAADTVPELTDLRGARPTWGNARRWRWQDVDRSVRTDRLPGPGGPGVNGTCGAPAPVAAAVVRLEVWRETVSSGCRW